ncbi:hypothetical protein ABES25_17170 [Bacillus gobiensis]|uniref:hypothetical protein n=1 Tax=Bacillus gobiensis TaxID=1441095 RepID=UPI003D223F4B
MIKQIAYYLDREDEQPNIALAEELCAEENAAGIKEIVDGLANTNKKIAADCIKVISEVGERKPELIAPYVSILIEQLNSKNNRMVWGAMTVLSKIAHLKPAELFEQRETIFHAYEKGSVITRDNSITVFAEQAKANKEYEPTMFRAIIEHLNTCRPKEVGQHAERAFVCVTPENVLEFKEVLINRRDMLSDPQKKRVDKLLKKCN